MRDGKVEVEVVEGMNIEVYTILLYGECESARVRE